MWDSLLIQKKKNLAQVFSCEFCEIFKTTFFTKHLRKTASVLRVYYRQAIFEVQLSAIGGSLKNGVLKNFGRFTEKHLYWSVFLIKLRVFKTYNFLNERLQHEWNYFEEHLRKTASGLLRFPDNRIFDN